MLGTFYFLIKVSELDIKKKNSNIFYIFLLFIFPRLNQVLYHRL